MKIKAMAKINLALDVLRRRPDGYHDVKMVMQTVDLYDELTIEKREDNQIRITTNIEGLECDENNLIYKAADRLMRDTGVTSGLDIHLEKHIPIAAGMAGGSTDAAATLVAVNELLGIGASLEKLKDIGVTIGADVPYCIEGGTQLSEGIGEVLRPLKTPPQCHIVIAKPDISVSTKYVYENLHVDTIEHHPDIDGMIAAIDDGDVTMVADKMENILENVTVGKYPIINEIKQLMLDHGAVNSLMSGSGPTVFGLFTDIEKAKEALAAIEEKGMIAQGAVTQFIDRTCIME